MEFNRVSDKEKLPVRGLTFRVKPTLKPAIRPTMAVRADDFNGGFATLSPLPLGFLPAFCRKFFRRRFGQPSETSTDHGGGEMQDPSAQNKREQAAEEPFEAADFCLIRHQ